MTTEINTVPAEALDNRERASVIISSTNEYAIEEIKRLLDDLDHQKRLTATQTQRATNFTSKYSNLFNSLEEFIKKHVIDDMVSIDDLRDFAEEVNIELTKSVKVSFNIRCEYEFNVPLDFTDDDIDESNFNIRISTSLSDDVEETSEAIEVEDFEVENND